MKPGTFFKRLQKSPAKKKHRFGFSHDKTGACLAKNLNKKIGGLKHILDLKIKNTRKIPRVPFFNDLNNFRSDNKLSLHVLTLANLYLQDF